MKNDINKFWIIAVIIAFIGVSAFVVDVASLAVQAVDVGYPMPGYPIEPVYDPGYPMPGYPIEPVQDVGYPIPIEPVEPGYPIEPVLDDPDIEPVFEPVLDVEQAEPVYQAIKPKYRNDQNLLEAITDWIKDTFGKVKLWPN